MEWGGPLPDALTVPQVRVDGKTPLEPATSQEEVALVIGQAPYTQQGSSHGRRARLSPPDRLFQPLSPLSVVATDLPEARHATGSIISGNVRGTCTDRSVVLEEFNTSNQNDGICQLNRDGAKRFSGKCLPRGFDMRVTGF